MRQFNVELPETVKKAIIRLQGKQQAENGEKMSLTEITLDAFSLWFAVDGLGLTEAFEEAKKRALEKLLADSKLELSGEDVATLMRNIRKAVDDGEKPLDRT
ncbi:MAG TPA: hypothetical protein VMW36_09820 [Patescibacteria group bacterium]|jgi:hypothetical protein|nr:hypothetical protein [Patescibacteria group bacterium]